MTVLPTKVSSPFSWTLPHLSSARVGPDGGRKGPSHRGGIKNSNPPPHPPCPRAGTKIFGNTQSEWCDTLAGDRGAGGVAAGGRRGYRELAGGSSEAKRRQQFWCIISCQLWLFSCSWSHQDYKDLRPSFMPTFPLKEWFLLKKKSFSGFELNI